YVNLSTARSMLRAKEVSMRKIIGASRVQIFIQFMAETALLYLIATVLSITVMYLLLPAYNSFSGKQLTLSVANYSIWMWILITLVITLAASSIYPALLLSSFEPLKALKGKIAAGFGTASFRKILVVMQFAASIVLIIGTVIIGSQLDFIRKKNLGYDKQNVFTFGMRDSMIKHYDAVKAELLKQPGVLAVTRSGDDIIDYNNWTGDNDWDGKPANSNLFFHPMLTDKDFVNFFKIKIVQGKDFSGDPADYKHFIVNEAAVKAMGLKDPIGKNMRIWTIRGTITGVMKDFNFTSMHKKIEPAVFIYAPKSSWRIYIKTTGQDAHQAVEAAQNIWGQYSHQIPFSYAFLDETFNNLYKTEQQTGSLFNIFAAIAICISCLGLFGLATYSAQVKTREIGIRKVLGASVMGIIRLLATEFMLLIFVSIFIAAPVAWYAMNRWLQDFAYKTQINWWVFIAAGGFATLIALATISVQSIKAALRNPVKSLRSE
ncbi:MAG TPA: FtsX-like permease family protein, partial [Mucilaginibacter sp.]|nr:FtsX-like permease family protein [Mucilaginibacter sp.]